MCLQTYCIDSQTADSACSATAYLGGVKANFFTIGVNGKVTFNDCEASSKSENHVHSLVYWAQKAGKGTGIVTTTTVTHASPAGTFGHTPNRMWESDSDILLSKKDPKQCQDLAAQLIRNEPGKNLKVILGGGLTKFIPKSIKDIHGHVGERQDHANLINEWKIQKPNAKFVTNREQLASVNLQETEYLLGLFASSHLAFNLDADRKKEPTLEEMTVAAIKVLEKEKKGYFLFVEGGKIDIANHYTKAAKALDETNEFAKAVQIAYDITDRADTLIVVTADHSSVLSMTGWAERGNDILGTMNNMIDRKYSGTF